MSENIVSNIIIILVHEIFDVIKYSDWLNLGENIRRDGEEIINCSINNREVVEVREELHAQDLEKNFPFSSSCKNKKLLEVNHSNN